MTFAYRYAALLLILPLFLALFFFLIRKKYTRDLYGFASREVIEKIMDLYKARIRSKQRILRVTCLVLLVAALCGPRWGYRWQESENKGLSIMFALDTSRSMLAEDILPSRLERSKLAIIDFLGRIRGNNAGLVAFAGKGFLSCPLSGDYNALYASLNSLGVLSIPRGGTAIGEAINISRKAFQAGEAGSKILIIITDGENHEGNPVNEALSAAKEGITVYTIGIGSPEGEGIPITASDGSITFLKDSQGNTVKTKLNDKVLQEIAAAGKGAYFKGTGVSIGLDELYRSKLLKHQRSEMGNKWQKRPVDRFQVPLLLAVLVLCLEIGMGFFRRSGVFRQDEMTGRKNGKGSNDKTAKRQDDKVL